jgi:putative methionine-R-sulfoxide reductase with GAF domain
MRVGEGVVGAAVEQDRPLLVNDIRIEPRYRGPLRNMCSQLAVPMRRKGKVIGALNLLDENRAPSRARTRRFSGSLRRTSRWPSRTRGLFRAERHYIDTLETLAEIGRESVVDPRPRVLLTRIASLTKRVIDYRTFGILLVNEQNRMLEIKLAVRYGEEGAAKNIKMGEGLVGWAADTGSRARRRRVEGPSLPEPRPGRPFRARDSRCSSRTAASASSTSRARS